MKALSRKMVMVKMGQMGRKSQRKRIWAKKRVLLLLNRKTRKINRLSNMINKMKKKKINPCKKSPRGPRKMAQSKKDKKHHQKSR